MEPISPTAIGRCSQPDRYMFSLLVLPLLPSSSLRTVSAVSVLVRFSFRCTATGDAGATITAISPIDNCLNGPLNSHLFRSRLVTSPRFVVWGVPAHQAHILHRHLEVQSHPCHLLLDSSRSRSPTRWTTQRSPVDHCPTGAWFLRQLPDTLSRLTSSAFTFVEWNRQVDEQSD